MAITGLLGFKAIMWDGEHFCSPSRKDFIWNNPVAISKCQLRSIHCEEDEFGASIIRENCTCGIYAALSRSYLNSDYCTDAGRPVLMLEALGNSIRYLKDSDQFTKDIYGVVPDNFIVAQSTWAHDWGFTSSRVLVVGITNLKFTGTTVSTIEDYGSESRISYEKSNYVIRKAANFFGVPIFDWDTAFKMAEIQWKKFGLEWKFDSWGDEIE